MNKILSVNAEDFDCRVQACVTKEQLNEYLREDGVFFPIDPGANAAIGVWHLLQLQELWQLNTVR